MWKIATSATGIGLALSVSLLTAQGAPRGGGGGGGPHPGGGGGGPHIGGGGAPHIGGGGAPHFSAGAARLGGGGGAPRFTAHAATPHFSGGSGTRFAAPTSHIGRSNFSAAGHGITAHGNIAHGLNNPAISHATPAINHAAIAGAHLAHAGAGISRGAFAAHRAAFASAAAFHPFFNQGWHQHNHLGWIGPLFWPYAYGDFFYYALWPDDYAYYDPFWVYGYPDIYEGIFSPYDYSDYVRGSDAPARMKQLTESMAQSCDDEAAEVTGWPIDQIASAVQPDQQQSALLDELGNAVVKASSTIKSNCPTTVSFTPTGRLDAMQQRLQGLVQAVGIVSDPLDKFYDSLSDEQKARFNSIKPPANTEGAPNGQATGAQSANGANPKSQCGESSLAWPTDQINRVVQPNDAQRAKLDALQAAVANGADTIKAACPSETPSTPPARLAAVGQHLQAMLQAVDSIRPPLHDFYNSLSDDQKARFNTMGKQLFAENK